MSLPGLPAAGTLYEDLLFPTPTPPGLKHGRAPTVLTHPSHQPPGCTPPRRGEGGSLVLHNGGPSLGMPMFASFPQSVDAGAWPKVLLLALGPGHTAHLPCSQGL